MKARGLFLNVLTGLLLVCFWGVPFAFAEVTPVAKVGSVVISQDDLELEMRKILPRIAYHGNVNEEKIKEIKKQSLEGLISRAYKVNYALDQKIIVDSKVVAADWDRFVAKNPAVEDANSSTVKVLKEYRYRTLLAEKAESVAVDDKVVVTDEEVKKYYEANKSMYFRGKLFKASHILVKVEPSESAESKEEKRQRAMKLADRAKSGEDFFNLAYYESDDRTKYVGGSLGSFHAGQTVPEFDAVIQKMKAGDISDPVQTLYGYHIIKLDEVQDERQLSFDEVAEKVKVRVNEEKRDKLYKKWMDGLVEKYPLQTF